MRPINDKLIAFGKCLKEIRKGKKLSYRKLALQCNVEYSYIVKIEKGEVSIQLITVFELAKGLGVEAKELFDF